MVIPVRETCDCWLCAGEDPSSRGDYERDVAWHVRSHGWSVIALPEEHELPGWAYSVGLRHSVGAPEVCMFGLRVGDMHTWLNAVGERVRDGLELRPGTLVHDVLDGHPLLVRPVHPSWHADLFAFAVDFYRQPPLPMVQLIWPDRHGLFPWEPGAGARCQRDQPSLWLPKDDHPPSLWTRLTDLADPPFPGVTGDSLVLGSRSVIDGSAPVAGIVHTAEGSWEFLDGEPVTSASDVGMVHLRHLVSGHPHVRDFADLPRGFVAWQEPDGNWSRSPVE
jgi:hypothetical protein